MQTIRTEKFGDLNFPNKSIAYTWNNSGQTVGLQLKLNGKEYTFVPQNIVEKGFIKNGKQYYLGNVLVGDNLKRLGTDGQYIDLSGVSDFDNYLAGKGLSNTGFLLPASVANEMKIISSVRNYDASGKEIGRGMSAGPIQGLSEINGKYVYVTTPMGRAQSTWIQPPGTVGYDGQGATGTHQGRYTYTKSKFGFIGEAIGSIATAIAGVPFLPEILAIATGNPMVAASIRGAEAGAAGVDPLEAGLRAGATAVALTPGATTAIGQGIGLSGQAATIAGGAALGAGISSIAGGDPLKGAIAGAVGAVGSTTYATSVGEALGVTGTAAPIVGNAVINAGLSGIAAAATGGDVEKSMLAGAVSGAAMVGANEFAEAVLGKENIADISNATGLSEAQVKSIFTTSVANGVTAEITGQGELLEVMKNSLIAQGVGAKSVNIIDKSFKETLEKNPEIRAGVLTATNGIATTATNAALQGIDVELALQTTAPGIILSSVQAYQAEADRQDELAAQREKDLVALQQEQPQLQVAGPLPETVSPVEAALQQAIDRGERIIGQDSYIDPESGIRVIRYKIEGYSRGDINSLDPNEIYDPSLFYEYTVNYDPELGVEYFWSFQTAPPDPNDPTRLGDVVLNVSKSPPVFNEDAGGLVKTSQDTESIATPPSTVAATGLSPELRQATTNFLIQNELTRLENELAQLSREREAFAGARGQFERISKLPTGSLDRELQGQLEQELADLEERATAAEARSVELERERGVIEGIGEREGEGLSDQDLLTFLQSGEVPGILRGEPLDGEEGAPEGTPEGEGTEPGAGEGGAGEGGAGEGGTGEGEGGIGELRTPLRPSLIFDRETGGRPETTPFASRVTGEALASILGEKEPLFGGDEDEQRAVWNRRSLRLLSRALGL